MRKELFVFMFMFILLTSLFAFPLAFADDDNDDSVDSSRSESAGNSDSGSDDDMDDDDETDSDSDEDEEDDEIGQGERSSHNERERTVTRHGEEYTITQTREFTRTRNEDGSITEIKIRIRETVNEAGETVKLISSEKTKTKSFGEDGEDIEVETELEIEQETENGEIRIKLSNNNTKELRVLPVQASDIARERLKARNITKMELRERVHNNVPRVVYHIEGDKPGRFLGIFKFAMKVETEIDPETGEVISTGKPWWAFLVAEDDELPEDPAGNETDTSDDETETEELCSELLMELECSARTDCQNVLDENQLWQSCEAITA